MAVTTWVGEYINGPADFWHEGGYTLELPAAAQAGDLAIAHLTWYSGSTGPTTDLTDDFTLLRDASSTNESLYYWAEVTDAMLSATWTQGSNSAGGQRGAIAVFRGWDGAAPAFVGAGTATGVTTHTLPASAGDNQLAVYFFSGSGGSSSGRDVTLDGSTTSDAVLRYSDAFSISGSNRREYTVALVTASSGGNSVVGATDHEYDYWTIEGTEPPDPDSGWWIEVWDLDNQNKLMDDWVPAVNCVFERVFNDIGSGSLTVPASWSRISELCDPPNDTSTLLKVYIDDYFRYAFRADQVEKTYQEDGNAVVRIFGPGYEAIVDDGDIPAADYPDNPSVAPDWVYGYTEIYSQGFESDSLDGWTADNVDSAAVSTAEARGGTASVLIDVVDTDPSPDVPTLRKTFTTEPGRDYRFTAYVQGTADFFLLARDMTADGAADFSPVSLIGTGGSATGSGGTVWDELSYTFTAPSTSTRLAVQTTDFNTSFYVDDITVEEGAAAASIGAIVNDLLVATQAQSNATALTDDFTDSTDSAGSAWTPSSLAMTVSDGPPFGTILDRAAGLGYEWEVTTVDFATGGDLGYELSLYNPGNLGTDYTGLTSAPTIRQGSIIYGGTSRQHVAKNVVRVVTAGGYWAEATDAASTAAIGRRVETIENAAVEGTAIAQELADARLAVHQDQAQAMWVQLSERSGVRPFLDFQVGDTIKVEMDETFGVSGWFRVREIRADLTGEGNEIQYAVDLRP